MPLRELLDELLTSLDTGPLITAFRHYDARPVRAVQSLEPITATPADAEVLGIEPGAPLMLVERTGWDARGRAVEYARDLYRGDRSRFISELTL